MSAPRVRFAPSPTGYLHVGGARTALFNWLYARRHGGKLVLRIEDTDKERSTDENTRAILEGMRWLGLDWDEGPEAGGPHGPYLQSQRGAIYQKYLDQLVANGRAYRCYCTSADLEQKRKQAEAEKRQYRYDRTCRDRTDAPALPFTLRLRVPLAGVTAFDDKVYGHVEVKNESLQDWVLARADGSPLYNFCVVVDDLEMEITLVMRGEDGLNNTQPQLTLYQALDRAPPAFAHLPFILGSDRSKLSKRHASVSVQSYQEMGYLPEALLNYLARLGWSHGDQEIFTMAELKSLFDLDAVGNTAGVFNTDKLLWLNQHWLKTLPPAQVGAQLAPFLAARGATAAPGPKLEAAVLAMRERSKTLAEMADGAKIFFTDGVTFDESAAKKFLTPESAPVLEAARAIVAAEPEPSAHALEEKFRARAEQLGVGLGKVAQPVRVALTGTTQSPPLFDVIVLLGREEALRRLDAALARARPAG